MHSVHNWIADVYDPRLLGLPWVTKNSEEAQEKRLIAMSIGVTNQSLGQFWARVERSHLGAPDRTVKTPAQLDYMRGAFDQQPFPDPRERENIALAIGLTARQVNAWFGQRRKALEFGERKRESSWRRDQEEREQGASSTAGSVCERPSTPGASSTAGLVSESQTWMVAQRQQEEAAYAEGQRQGAEAERQRRRQTERGRREAEAGREARAREEAEAALAAQPDRELSVLGEFVRVKAGGAAAATSDWIRARGAVLDTGNNAISMISPALAVSAGLVIARDVTISISGTNGHEVYPTAPAWVCIRNETYSLRIAVGGTIPLLLGLDVIDHLNDAGFYLPGRAAAARRVANPPCEVFDSAEGAKEEKKEEDHDDDDVAGVARPGWTGSSRQGRRQAPRGPFVVSAQPVVPTPAANLALEVTPLLRLPVPSSGEPVVLGRFVLQVKDTRVSRQQVVVLMHTAARCSCMRTGRHASFLQRASTVTEIEQGNVTLLNIGDVIWLTHDPCTQQLKYPVRVMEVGL